MDYYAVKKKLLALFHKEKLNAKPGEWGFFNEAERGIRRVGYATNLTPQTIEAADGLQIDFMLTHHDSWAFVYGLKERCNQLLLRAGIAHGFFHAPLDDADFGTSASLALALGIKEQAKVIPYEEVFFAGRLGELEAPVPFEQFSAELSRVLGEPVRQFRNSQGPVRRICVTAGGGHMTNDIKIAVDAGCDTYITGEYALYSQQYARLAGMNLLVGSHTGTELPGVRSMAERLAEGTSLEIVCIPESKD